MSDLWALLSFLGDLFGIIFIFTGVAFSVIGVVGILRLPNTYTRLHATGKTSTLGVLFIALGTFFILPTAILNLIALGIFVIFSSPVGSHAIAAAVHRGNAYGHNIPDHDQSEAIHQSGVHQVVDGS